MDEIKETLRKLKPFLGNKADQLWLRYQLADFKEREQWAIAVRALAQRHRVNEIDPVIVLPPPSAQEALGALPLGTIQYLNKEPMEFGLRLPELTRHLGIFGSTGTGKTTLAKNLLRQLAAKGIPFMVFDWERNYRDLILDCPNLKVITIGSELAPFRFNFFRLPPGLTYPEYVKAVIDVFNRAYVGGVGSDSILLKVFDQAYRENETPTTQDAMLILAKEMQGGSLKGREMLWKQSSLRMLQFLSYGGTGKVFNTTKSWPMEELVKEQVVFELGALSSPQDKRFFIEIFTLWYWLYLEHQGMEDEKLKHVVLFEEFHNLQDNSKKEDLLQKIFRQIRKYGTGLVVLDQTPFLIPNPIFENLYTKISFSLSHRQNVMAITGAMTLEKDQVPYLGLLQPGQAIGRLMGRIPRPFLLSVPFLKPSQQITDELIRERGRDSYQDSSPKTAAFFESGPLPVPTLKATPSPLERIFLEDVLRHPFDGVDKRGKRLGLAPRDVVSAQGSLLAGGFLKPVTVDRRKLFELTPNGDDFLVGLGYKIDRRHKSQGLEHRYFVDQVARALMEQGWVVTLEKDGIDLVAARQDDLLALELETGTNSPEQIKKNLTKLLSHAAQGKVMAVTGDQALVRIRAIATEQKVTEGAQLIIVSVKDFLKSPLA